MVYKSTWSGDETDLYNFNDSMNLFMKKCNYMDTLGFTIIVNLLEDLIDQSSKRESLDWIKWVLRTMDLSTIIVDLAEISMGLELYGIHKDNMNLGELIGKAMKIVSQFVLLFTYIRVSDLI